MKRHMNKRIVFGAAVLALTLGVAEAAVLWAVVMSR